MQKSLKCIENLPPGQAEAIRLKYIDDCTLKEIESITGVPAKNRKKPHTRRHEKAARLFKTETGGIIYG